MSKAKSAEFPIYFFVQPQPPDTKFIDTAYGHVLVAPRIVKDGRTQACNSDHLLGRFQLYCQIDNHSESASYAWSATLKSRQPDGYVDEHDAGRIYDFLHKLNKKYEKLSGEFGSPLSFGQFCARYASIIKIEGIVRVGHDHEFIVQGRDILASAIDSEVKAIREKCQEVFNAKNV